MKNSSFNLIGKIGVITINSMLIVTVAMANTAPPSLDALSSMLQQETQNAKTGVQCDISLDDLAIKKTSKLDTLGTQKDIDFANNASKAMVSLFDTTKGSEADANVALGKFSQQLIDVKYNKNSEILSSGSMSQLEFDKTSDQMRKEGISLAQEMQRLAPAQGIIGKTGKFLRSVPILGRIINRGDTMIKNQQSAQTLLGTIEKNYLATINNAEKFIKLTENSLVGLDKARRDIKIREAIIEQIIENVQNERNSLGEADADRAKFLDEVVLVTLNEDLNAVSTLYQIYDQTYMSKQLIVRLGKKSVRMAKIRQVVAMQALANAYELAIAMGAINKMNQGSEAVGKTAENLMQQTAQMISEAGVKTRELQKKGPIDIQVLQNVFTSVTASIEADDAFQAEYKTILEDRNKQLKDMNEKADEAIAKMNKRRAVERNTEQMTGINSVMSGGAR